MDFFKAAFQFLSGPIHYPADGRKVPFAELQQAVTSSSN
jgi:hypothetical protein